MLQSKQRSFFYSRSAVEEPNQRQCYTEPDTFMHHEHIRLLVLGVSLLLILCGFLGFLFAQTVLPLFLAITLAFSGYLSLDAYLRTLERYPPG